MILYHGTSSTLLPKIRREGLVGEDDIVHLTTSRRYAADWARRPEKTGVILKVSIPRQELDRWDFPGQPRHIYDYFGRIHPTQIVGFETLQPSIYRESR